MAEGSIAGSSRDHPVTIMIDARNPFPEHGLLRKIGAVIAGAILLVLGLMFSVVLLAVISVVGLTAFGYFWWKTRGIAQGDESAPGERAGH